jgi:hypothetical protein
MPAQAQQPVPGFTRAVPLRPINRHGDYILDAAIPMPKLLVFNRLLPQMLEARVELVVIGGVCEVCIRAL